MASQHPPQGVIPQPPGYVVDMNNPERKKDTATYIVCAVGIPFSSMFLAMRIYTKARISRSLKTEDIFVIVAWICGVATQAIVIHNFRFTGEGTHLWEITLDTYNIFQKLTLASSVVYVPCLGFAKFSLLLLYQRLAPRKWFDNRWFHVSIYCVMIIVLGYSFAITFALIFACSPIKKTWDASVPGQCIDEAAIYVMTAVVNIGTDVVIFLLSVPLVWKLGLPFIQRVGVVFMFGVGSLTVVTSIIRLVKLFPMLSSVDHPWAVATPSVWICVEANLVIICCSLPALRQFLRHVCPRYIGERSSDPSRGSSDTYRAGSREHPDPYRLEPEADFTKRDLAMSGSPSKEMTSDKNIPQRTSDDNSEQAFAARSPV